MNFLRLTFTCFILIINVHWGMTQVDYNAYDQILSQNVSPTGKVDYTALIKNDKSELNQFLEELSATDPDKLNRDQRLAYWINAYNAFTIQLIVEHWPVNSIKDIAQGEPWDKKWIKLNGNTYSLNQIENEIIRPEFKDARIHFAVNCAAKSCPPLLNEPYLSNKLNQQLDSQTKKFLNNSNYNQLSENSIQISSIFDWYKDDFGNVIDFINKYVKTTIKSDATIRYTTYNWNLNN